MPPTDSPAPDAATGTGGVPDEVARARQARIDEARRWLLDDVSGAGQGGPQQPAAPRGGDPMQDVLFGRGGIPQRRNEEDELFSEGMNPDSFY
jgi:hypothetical protein